MRRGIDTVDAIDNFLSPKLSRLTPPSLWPSIPETAEILTKALLEGKKIVIWGDYDVDGITATALCLEVLEHHHIPVEYYLPNRNTEGYGLNIQGIEALAAKGCSVLLTVDCGISNVLGVQRAKELGMTVVISDHHLAPREIPKADALCNPKIMPAEKTPYPDLAGVGVAFYLMAEVNRLLSQKCHHTPYRMDNVLDLVALGTLADLMPLTGENRILVAGGLRHIKKAHRLGIAALKMVSGFNIASEMKSIDISFKLVPRLNAAGRIEHAQTALALLRSRNREEAVQLAEHLDQLNQIRRAEEDRILMEARVQAEEQIKKTKASLVLYGAAWHSGIIGIVASRIVDEFGKPTIVMCKTKNGLKGSGRSVGQIDLHGVLTGIQDLLLVFGGHKAAAALTIKEENLELFRRNFDEAVFHSLKKEVPEQPLILDGELNLSSAFCAETLDEIALMEPFGQNNPEPIFASPPLVVERHDAIGYDRKNILLTVKDTTSGVRMQAKGWRLGGDFPPSTLAGKIIRLAYVLRLNTFRGIPQPELEIKDLLIEKTKANSPQAH